MPGITDSAVGAILSIPPEALGEIEKAEKAIKDLADTSKKAAEQVKAHWSTTALEGLDAFIRKLTEAQNAMGSMGDVKVTFNTSQAVQQGQALSQQMQKTSADVSQSAQQISKSFNISEYGHNLTEVLDRLANLKQKLKNTRFADPKAQELVNQIRQIETLVKEFKNAEIVAKRLTAEYKRLDQEAHKIAASMSAFVNAGGSRSDSSYLALESQWNAIQQRMAAIGRQNIDEINAYRQQMTIKAYQDDLSAFIQNEAQKKQAAIQAAQEVSNSRKAAYQQYLNTYEGALRSASKLEQGRTSGNYADTYENRARVIKQLENAIKNLSTADANYERKVQELSQKLRELGVAQAEVNRIMKSQPTPTLADAQKATAIANATKSLNDYKAAYEKLTAVMKTMDSTSTPFKNAAKEAKQLKYKIEECEKAMGQFKQQSSSVARSLGQIGGLIAGAFSIGAINGFIKKVVETRAQFELQRVALGAIIQDVDRANKMFTEVQNMALQSPFTIMGLERATKQVAAFGFETEKIVPTVKMLADMSAGLGVEIDRLVLVMGHLKARNYLEGTMVRQFTNAGFNVLGELSKLYSELEGRMVSVAEVQTRVKKKMVEFGDVEEVLKRVTSAGGMFYDMQKKQSDSIWGQMQRITDAYDLMLNEIGKSNEGSIKWALTAVRDMIQNWRKLAPIIKSVVVAMGSYMAVATGMKVVSLTIKGVQLSYILLKNGIEAAKAAQQGLNITMMSNPYAAVAAVIAGLLVSIGSLLTSTSQLNEEFSRIGEDITNRLNESLAMFKQLTDTITDNTKSYTERTEAVNELNRVYGEILPKEKLEQEYIQGLAGDYSELRQEIIKYYEDKEYHQKADAVLASDEAKRLKKQVKETVQRANEDLNLGQVYSDSVIQAWADKIAEELATGKLQNSIDAIQKRLEEVFGGSFADYLVDQWSDGLADIEDIVQQTDKVLDNFGNISVTAAGAANAVESFGKSLEKASGFTLNKNLEELEKEKANIKYWLERGQIGQKDRWGNYISRSATNEELEKYREQLKNVEEQINATREAAVRYFAQQWAAEIQEQIKNLQNQVQAYWDLQMQMDELERQGKKNSKEWENLKDKQDEAKKSADDMADTLGTKIPWGMVAAAKTTFEFNKAVKALGSEVDWLSMKLNGLLNSLGNYGSALKGIFGEIHNFSSSIFNTGSSILGKIFSGGGGQNITTPAQVYSDLTKKYVKQYGASMKELDKITKDGDRSSKEMAAKLRERAKQWEDDVAAYNRASDKKTFLEGANLTIEQIKEAEKNAKAARAIADDLWKEEKKGGKGRSGSKGKDLIEELWKNRIDALKRYYDAAEKARKHLSESETKTEQEKSFKNLWASLGLNDVKGLSLDDLIKKGFDPTKLKDDYVGALDLLLSKIPDKYKEIRTKLQETIASESIEIKFKIAEQEREKLQKDIDNLFDNYELTKTFADLGLNIDLTYVVGGKPTKLSDVRKKLEEMSSNMQSDSLEDQKMYQKNLDKLQELEHKNQIERIKNYNKYLLESMSDRVQIEAKALKEISALREAEYLNDTTKEMAIMRRKEQMRADLAKQEWKDFQGSDLYISMFEDIEHASTQSLQYMLEKLNSLKTSLKDLPADQLRAIVKQIDSIESQINKRNPFKTLADNIGTAIQAYKQLKNASIQFQKANEAYEAKKKERDDYALGVAALEEQLSILHAKLGVDEAGAQIQNSITIHLQAQLNIMRQILETLNLEVKGAEEQKNKWADVVEKLKEGKEASGEALQQIGSWAQELSSAIGDIASSLENVFGTMSDGTKDTIEVIQGVVSGLGNMASGVGRFLSGDVIGGAIQAVTGLVSTLATLFSIGDRKKERQIKRLQDKVEQLDKAYRKLQKSIEAAYNFDDYNAGYSQALANLQKQKEAYKEMLRLESAKKKTDKSKIKEYQDALDDIAEKEEELHKKRIEDMGSTTDYLSQAQSFVDAWLDAYREVGDGTDALKESWDEFIDNLVIRQAAAAVVSNRLKNIIDIINTAIDSGKTGLDLSETIKAATEEWKKNAALTDAGLKAFFEAMGVNLGNGEFVLSDLQQGIQNITEPQAAAIEAYLNSMRFAVFRHTEQLDTLIMTIQAQYNSESENPVIRELKGIRGVLDSIDRRLGSVIKQKAGTGNYLNIG